MSTLKSVQKNINDPANKEKYCEVKIEKYNPSIIWYVFFFTEPQFNRQKLLLIFLFYLNKRTKEIDYGAINFQELINEKAHNFCKPTPLSRNNYNKFKLFFKNWNKEDVITISLEIESNKIKYLNYYIQELLILGVF